MRQRLALAAALLGDPETLVLDEPANGLDPEGVHWLRGLLRGLADQGRTVFVSSHLLAELAQTVDDVVIINHGPARGRRPDGRPARPHRRHLARRLLPRRDLPDARPDHPASTRARSLS
jgi:ABC-2 type transport system ATP-binding protein